MVEIFPSFMPSSHHVVLRHVVVCQQQRKMHDTKVLMTHGHVSVAKKDVWHTSVKDTQWYFLATNKDATRTTVLFMGTVKLPISATL